MPSHALVLFEVMIGPFRNIILFCFVLFSLQLSMFLWWHDYRRDDFPTLKFVVVMADLARHLLRFFRNSNQEPMWYHICPKLHFVVYYDAKNLIFLFVVLVARRELTNFKGDLFRFVALIGSWFLVPELRQETNLPEI